MRLIDAARFERRLMFTVYRDEICDDCLRNFLDEMAKEPAIAPVKHGRWISVNDSLPENGENLVVAYSPKTHNSNKVMIMKARNLRVRAEKGWSTHWVPIPELPIDEDLPTENAEAAT